MRYVKGSCRLESVKQCRLRSDFDLSLHCFGLNIFCEFDVQYYVREFCRLESLARK